MIENIKQLDFDSKAAGPKLVVLGRVHGDEPCGQTAIEKLAVELSSGALRLERGSLRMLPCCNPEAAYENKRYIDKNLNRVFRQTINQHGDHVSLSYEERLANVLIEKIGRPDFLLDLHSFLASENSRESFAIYRKRSPVMEALVKRLPIGYVLGGWHELQKSAGRTVSDSITHAASVGAAAFGIECGSHDDPGSAERAYAAIRAALDEMKMIPYAQKTASQAKELTFKELYLYPENGGEFARPWSNFEPVKKGDLLATPNGAQALRADFDGYMVMPHPHPRPGDEWFYLAI